jgi:hypothetical protein
VIREISFFQGVKNVVFYLFAQMPLAEMVAKIGAKNEKQMKKL